MVCSYFCLLLLFLPSIYSLEEPEPEVLLQPRNYNPHPYENAQGRSLGSRRGPILFPQEVHSTATGLTFGRPDVGVEHPYANVARKQRVKLGGRFSSEQDGHISPHVYSGLSSYAAKVLKKPGGVEDYGDVALSGHKKDYAFAYAVRDHATGDDFSHRQMQNTKATQGEYRVKLPDGRIQVVSYRADKNGYKADVKYLDASSENNLQPIETPILQAVAQPIQKPVIQSILSTTPRSVVQPILVPVSTPSPTNQIYDYPFEQRVPYQGQHPTTLTQIEVPIYEDRFHVRPVTPKISYQEPKYVTIYPPLQELQKHYKKYIPHDKVEIYPQGEQKLEDEVPEPIQTLSNSVHTTVRPYSTIGHVLKGYTKNILVSTVPPNYRNHVYVTPTRHTIVSTSPKYY